MDEKSLDVCIVGGCGHVGLPLAILFAHNGLRVGVYDVNEVAAQAIQTGKMPFREEGAEPLLAEVLREGMLTFSSSPEMISQAAIIILIIGTPIDEHLDPKFSIMRRMMDGIIPFMDDSQLLILRSTVYPGTTRRIRSWLEEGNCHMDLAFCPERILEGKAISELQSLPQIVSSFSESGIRRASDLFSRIAPEILVVDPMEAELAKLYSNVWRYINFAVANQFYMIANDYGVDYYKVHRAMTRNYPRCKTLPQPGFAAGPCLFKDTMQLAAFSNNEFFLGHSAMLANEGLPNYIFLRLKRQFDLSQCTVGILGMAFKSESDDVRESLSFKLKKLSEFESKRTLCSDPYVSDYMHITSEQLVEESDIIIVATPHHCYQSLEIPQGKKVVDVWNIFNHGGLI